MKKSLFILATAAIALASCNNDVKIAENKTLGNQPQEISLTAFSNPAKYIMSKAPVDGTAFPTDVAMKVAAYDVTHTRDFFGATTFSYSGAGTIWAGGKYWPLSASYINFLAIANANADNETGVTWGAPSASASPYASKAVVVMSDNSSAQKDLMYAIGNGEVTQSDNSLTFPTNVPMVFKHAQAWVSFYADAYDGTSGGKVTLNSITLNGAKYNGTYTVTHTAYNAKTGQSVAGAWSALGDAKNIAVPGWSAAAVAYDESGDGVAVGNGLLIVPDDDTETADFTSFTINYTLDGNTYEYTYTPASKNVDQAKHYIFNINFHLHEILISATVTDWADQTPVSVPVF